MTIHKVTAGSGYDYLTRQVAAHDVTERGHSTLASYYSEKGESPGVWLGSGLAGVEGLQYGDMVTEAHMRNLFGSGRHPLANEIRLAAMNQGLDPTIADRGTWLGRLYPVYVNDIPEFRKRVALRMIALNEAAGLEPTDPGDPDLRAQVRTAVAKELFEEEHGRAPVDERELMGAIARHSRPQSTAVAGFDLTFSPVKSVSTLWAIAPADVAATIERCHRLAVSDALGYIEKHALFTREGARGVRQVETRGLVAAAFTHRDSRAGDPDLHTHVAVANKVQARESGKWLAIDGRVIFKANISASETYNTALEHHLSRELGVVFQARPGTDPAKRPIREIVGIDARLNTHWSTRRADIVTRRDELARRFQADHGRPPTNIEAKALAQQANLETRPRKHHPRPLDQQRQTWAMQAREVLGSAHAVEAMLTTALHPQSRNTTRVDAAWVNATAARMHDVLASRRSFWQRWHVHAEALRQVRTVDLNTGDVEHVVNLLVDQVLTAHSTPLTRPNDPTTPADLPQVLRRSDGSSVYDLAGSTMYTSPAILAAEQRILTRAGQYDGTRLRETAVEDAIAGCARVGVILNAGQATLVREMATSGARVQLAIAPAGAGKTTAMTALSSAWVNAGGTVLGLAPSAAAAAVLGESTDAVTDTLAKLAWHIHHPSLAPLPDWMENIGPRTLVVIDEAGMADTLTLDAVIEYVTARGGSVRLIGDDRQLAALGGGGILRDIHATHGALQLSELMRFTNTAEANASLALREGLPEAVGFYLDHHRLHIGDQATLTDDILTAWTTDQTSGLDSIMLAPTRDLVAELNHRARTHRLTTTAVQEPTATVVLADGNQASAGDTIITRSNDRRLRMSATDWVKNGDRWTITAVDPDHSITARHVKNGRHITLPPEYVAGSVELGYATTIHTAQGVTADTSHTLLTGGESRQVAYTAITRGRAENHLYLQVIGDGDPHSVIRPEHTHPSTPAELLQGILSRDDAARSATTIARDTTDPHVLLGQAVAQYVDALHVAAEKHLGPEVVARLDEYADRVVSGVTAAPAWEALRAHLILHAVETQADPLTALQEAAGLQEIDTAGDVAAVIDWRLDPSGHRSAGTGPLPWLPGIPADIADFTGFGPYLAGQAVAIHHHRHQVIDHLTTSNELPGWARQGQARPDPQLLAEVTIFRAAVQVDPADRRPTGPPQFARAVRTWQNRLNHQLLRHDRAPAMAEWSEMFTRIFTGDSVRTDGFLPVLAERLSAISRAGIHAPSLIRDALAEGVLPDEQQAAALWWRITNRLSPAVAAQVEADHHRLTTPWSHRLLHLIGDEQASVLQGSPWWPTLVTVIDHATARGHTLETLLRSLPEDGADVDACQGLVWRISLLNDTPSADEHHSDGHDTHPATGQEVTDQAAAVLPEVNPFWQDTPDPAVWAPTDAEWADIPAAEDPEDLVDGEVLETDTSLSDEEVDAILTWAALARSCAEPLDPSDAEVNTALRRAIDADTAAVSPERILQLNDLALTYYTTAFPGSWAQTHLTERLRVDITGHPTIQPGYAPAGWTTLLDHLRAHGASDRELTASGLATTTRDGRLIDRFRDRLILPITRTSTDGDLETLGFVARANPHVHPQQAGPKYLNTPDTVAFHKSAQLYTSQALSSAGDQAPTAVLVEGPLDAIAITVATNSHYVGVASLGTSLTEEQARHLARTAHQSGRNPVVAFDADQPGLWARDRAHWMLTPHGLDPQIVALRPGADPADTLTLHGPQVLHDILTRQSPLSTQLIETILDDQHLDHQAARRAIDIITTADPQWWDSYIDQIAERTNLPAATSRRILAEQLKHWQRDPRTVAQKAAQRSTGQSPSSDPAPATNTVRGQSRKALEYRYSRDRASRPRGPSR